MASEIRMTALKAQYNILGTYLIPYWWAWLATIRKESKTCLSRKETKHAFTIFLFFNITSTLQAPVHKPWERIEIIISKLSLIFLNVLFWIQKNKTWEKYELNPKKSNCVPTNDDFVSSQNTLHSKKWNIFVITTWEPHLKWCTIADLLFKPLEWKEGTWNHGLKFGGLFQWSHSTIL